MVRSVTKNPFPSRPLLLIALLAAALSPHLLAQPKPTDKPRPQTAIKPTQVLVRVDGVGITQGDLQRMYLTRGVPESMQENVREQMLAQLIDARLMQRFLALQKIDVDKKELEARVQKTEELVKRRSGGQKTLADLGYTTKSIRDDLSLPMAWKIYAQKTVTDDQIRKYFDEHKPELDGTQLRVSHILIKANVGDSEEKLQAAEKKLAGIRQEIEDKKLSFEAAAAKYSEAPSKEQGGDIGLLTWEGKMPEAFSKEAFALKVGEVSQPFRTHFGYHLALVKERIPGDLSLEDARREVLQRLTQQLWEQKLSELRQTAKIEPVKS
ncbi:MAG: peptidylprolyl isomerase [Planctomycetales bacterium]